MRNVTNSSQILVAYFYDSDGQRVKKLEYNIDGSVKRTTYYPQPDFVREMNGSTADSVYYIENGLQIAQNISGTITYVHPDHRGSPDVKTALNGTLIETMKYGPYGNTLNGGTERYLFTGQERDYEIALDYFDARYYSYSMGQFAQADTTLPDVYDPQQLNRYAYVVNNPYKYRDPDGRSPVLLIGVVAGMGVLSAGYEAYVQYSVTGEIYSYSRIGGAFVGGVGEGVLTAAGLGLELTGVPSFAVAGLAIQAYSIQKTLSDIEASHTAAHQYLSADSSPKINQREASKSGTGGSSGSSDGNRNNAAVRESQSSNLRLEANQASSSSSARTGNAVYDNSRYSSSEPNRRADVAPDGTVSLGRGGSHGTFRCNAKSCSATPAYRK